MTTTPTDDAPASASKHDTSPAADAVPQAQGDSVVARAVTIAKPVSEVYGYFRDFAKLPTFMENVVAIDVRDPKTSHWTVKAPGGGTVEWDAIVTEDEPDRLIAWTTAEGADVPNSGRVEFRDAGERGTVVTATLLYDPPGGIVGKVIAKLFQREPAIQARRDLNRFKQLMETGEVATAAVNKAQFEKEGI